MSEDDGPTQQHHLVISLLIWFIVTIITIDQRSYAPAQAGTGRSSVHPVVLETAFWQSERAIGQGPANLGRLFHARAVSP